MKLCVSEFSEMLCGVLTLVFPLEASKEKIKTWVLFQSLLLPFSAFFRELHCVLVCFLVTAIVLPPFVLQCPEHPTEWWGQRQKQNKFGGGVFLFFSARRPVHFNILYSLSYCCSTSFKFSDGVSQYGSDRAGSKENDSFSIWPLSYTVRFLTPTSTS